MSQLEFVQFIKSVSNIIVLTH